MNAKALWRRLTSSQVPKAPNTALALGRPASPSAGEARHVRRDSVQQMKYNLRIWAAGHGPGISITSAEYSDLLAAVKRIRLATGIEEKLDLLLENYLEYERELLNLGLQSSLFNSIDDDRVSREAHLVSRRALNLLAAARMYIDQVKHSVSRYSDSGDTPNVAALLSVQYDQHIEYRVAEELRNHAQHRALPVHLMSWASEWEGMETSGKRLRFSIVPRVSIEELATEGDFKAAVLRELQEIGKQHFSLTPTLRRYIECLALVHEEVRRFLSPQADLDYQTLIAALDRARTELHEETVALVISAGEDDEHPEEHHYVSERPWTRRQTLIRKNSQLSKLSRRYVSAEYPGDFA